MKKINTYILEKLHLNKELKQEDHYNYHPKTNLELLDLCDELIYKRRPNLDLNDIDVSEIDNFDNIFNGLNCDGLDISKWDVSNAKSMECMFSWTERFDCDLSKWEVSNVKNMTGMFANSDSFTGKGLEEWKINKDVKMNDMFINCPNLIKKPSWYHE